MQYQTFPLGQLVTAQSFLTHVGKHVLAPSKANAFLTTSKSVSSKVIWTVHNAFLVVGGIPATVRGG
jgi:hypothetical protein